MIATTAPTSSTSSSSTYVILPTSLSTSSSAANIRSQTQALANLAFRVRVFECSSADHGQQQQQYPTAHSGGLPLDGRQAESDLVPLVQGHEPIVDQIVEWQEQILPPIPLTSATGPFLHTHTHSQLLSHLTSASRHAATRLARSSAIDMHVYLSIPSPSSSSARNNSRAAYTLARMRLSPASGALSVSPPLGILARLAIDSSTTAATSARALAWIYVVELHAAPLPQAQVLETLRLGLASLKQSHLLSPLPPTRLLHPPPPDLRHTNRVYVNTTLSSFTLRITETKLPLYASHVSVAWRIELGGGGWQVADEAQVLAGTSHRVRVEAPSLWAYVWVAVWRWLWWVVMGGAIGGTKDGQVRKVALGVPVDVVLVQRAAQADPSARPLLHLTIYSDPLTTTPARRPASSSSASRSSMRGPNRYLLGTCTIPLPLTPAGAVAASAKRSYAIHRPVLPPSVLMPESLFGTPALPADSKWPTVVAGHVEVAASVAVQAARAGGATMGMGSGAGILGVMGSPGGAGGVNAESVQAAVVRARSRLAAIKAAQAGTAAGGTAGS